MKSYKAVDVAALPKHFESEALEKRWGDAWEKDALYRYDPSRSREETFVAGDAYYAPPGHVPAVTRGTELVEFSPAEAFAETMAVVARNLAAGVGA